MQNVKLVLSLPWTSDIFQADSDIKTFIHRDEDFLDRNWQIVFICIQISFEASL